VTVTIMPFISAELLSFIV